MKKAKILAAIFSIAVLLSGACLVGCSGTNGVFGPTYNDWEEGENKVGNATINLTGFNQIELSDATDKSDVKMFADRAYEILSGFQSQCLQYANNGKGLKEYKDQIKYNFLTSELSKCADKPTDKSLIESTAKDMTANHISYFQKADNSNKGCVLYQVEMSDDVFDKILNQEDGDSRLGITEIGPGVYKSNWEDSDGHFPNRFFYCLRSNGIFTLFYPWGGRNAREALGSEIMSY